MPPTLHVYAYILADHAFRRNCWWNVIFWVICLPCNFNQRFLLQSNKLSYMVYFSLVYSRNENAKNSVLLCPEWIDDLNLVMLSQFFLSTRPRDLSLPVQNLIWVVFALGCRTQCSDEGLGRNCGTVISGIPGYLNENGQCISSAVSVRWQPCHALSGSLAPRQIN